MFRPILPIVCCVIILAPCPKAEEVVVSSVDLPGASMEQEITYSTTKADYTAARDDRFERLKNGDPSAFVNSSEGPWMRVETTAKIGFAYKGIGTSEGRKNLSVRPKRS